jgi:hypothetical protein
LINPTGNNQVFWEDALQILTDRGSKLRTPYWTNLLQKYDIRTSLSSSVYAQTDSLPEPSIQLIVKKLRILSINKIRITNDILATAAADINLTISFETKDRPSCIFTKFIDYSLTENELRSFRDDIKRKS